MENSTDINEYSQKPDRESVVSEFNLPPERIKQFENLIEPIDTSLFLWQAQKQYTDFETQINVNPHLRGDSLAVREKWIEMKAAGKDFKQFAENYIKNKLDADNTNSVYKLLHIYDSLAYQDSAEFLGEVLNHETIWKNIDGSNSHYILEMLSGLQKSEAVPALAQHVRNIFLPQYNRIGFRDRDVNYALNALNSIGGDRADKEITSLQREYPHIEWRRLEASPRSH